MFTLTRYGGSFPCILLLLGQKVSFVIPRTTLRGLLYRGSTVKSLHSISNRDNRDKSSFLGFLSLEDFQKYTPCMSTVGNAKNNCVGLSENTNANKFRTRALKKRFV